jgi:hypothetical protein
VPSEVQSATDAGRQAPDLQLYFSFSAQKRKQSDAAGCVARRRRHPVLLFLLVDFHFTYYQVLA